MIIIMLTKMVMIMTMIMMMVIMMKIKIMMAMIMTMMMKIMMVMIMMMVVVMPINRWKSRGGGQAQRNTALKLIASHLQRFRIRAFVDDLWQTVEPGPASEQQAH